ncbi:LysM peptidoglycan-binding domain-containing protein [Ectothiorhodospiraceae bacterium 2226]|nr:LysM peptidoglycan-binding domain-containing protein [Ectothiorhodospiraceae bacterium 2226]
MLAAEQRRAQAGGEATEYNVQRGDSLWSISGKAEVYNNPYHWPLIYRTNRDQITDADLIYPGQRFRIERNFSQQDIDAAAQHARTRGEWELGRVEQSDQDYLRGRR